MPYTIKTSVAKYRQDADHDYVGIDGFDASLIDDESTDDPRRSWSTQKLKQEFDLKADLALKGAPEGLAELDANGKVPSSQLPSYVDDVLEGYVNPAEHPNYTHFYKKRTAQSGGTYGYSDPYTPETGKIYVDIPTGKCYRWGGSVYAEVSNNDASVIAIERNGLTFTATRADRTTFTFTQQDNDTKNTAGSIENLDKKMYLVGAETQATSPQTRSNSKCFIGADNKLRSNDDVVLTDSQIDDTAGDGDTKKLWSADRAKKYVDGWMNYREISISSFSVSPSITELGGTITSVTFTLKLNKEAQEIYLDGVKVVDDEHTTITHAPDGSLIKYTIVKSGLSLTASKTWRILVKDKQPDLIVVEKTTTTTLTFTYKVKYGAAAEPNVDFERMNATDIANLDAFLNTLPIRTLKTSLVSEFTLTVGTGTYFWYAVPVNYGPCSFKIGGFTGGVREVARYSHTNESGGQKEYYVYRSVNPGFGYKDFVVRKIEG